MASNDKLKILIVDDHDIVRKGLAMLVSRQQDLTVVAEAAALTRRTWPVSVSTSTSAAQEANVQKVEAMGYSLPSGAL